MGRVPLPNRKQIKLMQEHEKVIKLIRELEAGLLERVNGMSLLGTGKRKDNYKYNLLLQKP